MPSSAATAPGSAAAGHSHAHERRPGRRQSGRLRQVRDRRQRERLRARQAAVVHRVAGAPTVLRVREQARHARNVQVTDLEAIVRLRETFLPSKERRIAETYLKLPSARSGSRKRDWGEAQHFRRRNRFRNRQQSGLLCAVLGEEVVRSRHAEATRLVLLLATILGAALDVQVTSGAVLVHVDAEARLRARAEIAALFLRYTESLRGRAVDIRGIPGARWRTSQTGILALGVAGAGPDSLLHIRLRQVVALAVRAPDAHELHG